MSEQRGTELGTNLRRQVSRAERDLSDRVNAVGRWVDPGKNH